MQVFSNARPTIPTISRYFDISVPYHTGSIRYFQMSYPRYPHIHTPVWNTVPRVYIPGVCGFMPGVCRVRYLTHGFEISVPYHTGSIRYFQMSYLRYQRYPGILRFRYLTIPARSGIFNSHTHPRYPRVPRYGIPRVYTRGMPGTVPYLRFL